MAAQKKQQRGGRNKPSRSAFRPKVKAGATKSKPASVAKASPQTAHGSKVKPPIAHTSKSTAHVSKSKQAAPKARPQAMHASKVNPPIAHPSKNPTASAKQVASPPKVAAKAKAKLGKAKATPVGPVVELGAITVPSGKLAVFDVGLVGYLPREALEPALIITEVPADRALPVVGARLGKGRFADCWDHVSVVIGEGDIARSRKLGEAGVDFARLVCMDHATLDRWVHDESLDGKADFVFWGRDAGALARAMRAPTNAEGHGWVDLAVADAEAKADAAARLKAENHWLLASDLRRHSHHYQVLAAARASGTGSGTLEIAGARLCLFFTSWGDGVFPVYLDADAAGQPVRIRIQLAASDPAIN